MGHVPEVSVQCLIGKCGVCPDPDCECSCHPELPSSPSFLPELLGPAGETEN